MKDPTIDFTPFVAYKNTNTIRVELKSYYMQNRNGLHTIIYSNTVRIMVWTVCRLCLVKWKYDQLFM